MEGSSASEKEGGDSSGDEELMSCMFRIKGLIGQLDRERIKDKIVKERKQGSRRKEVQ